MKKQVSAYGQHARVYSRATSGVARSFLCEVAEELGPAGVQVDGGSEFMGVFEEECEALVLPLKVLPPRFAETQRHRRARQLLGAGQVLEPAPGGTHLRGAERVAVAVARLLQQPRPHRSLRMRTPAQAAADLAALHLEGVGG